MQTPHWYFAGGAALYDVLYCFQSACSVKVYVVSMKQKGGGGGQMNHSSHGGYKVHFLSRQTISQALQDVAVPPDINLHWRQPLSPQRGDEEGAGRALI